MKVVHVNIDDSNGGAPTAAKRIVEAQRANGIEACLLVLHRTSDLPYVYKINVDESSRDIKKEAEMRLIQSAYINARRGEWNTLYTLGYPGIDITELDIIAQADVVNLHMIEQTITPIIVNKLLVMGKKVVWTLHDQRPFSGGPHYLFKVDNTSDISLNDNQISGDKIGISIANLKDQKSLYNNKNLKVVCPSGWLAKSAKSSYVFKDHDVSVIRNAHPISTFKSKTSDKHDNFVILLGASNNKEYRKGFHIIEKAISDLESKIDPEVIKNIEIKIVGQEPDKKIETDFKVIYTGYLSSTEDLVKAYSDSSVFILSTLSENYSNQLCEAMLCGVTPIVSNVGGNIEIVENNISGYVFDIDKPVQITDILYDLIKKKKELTPVASRERIIELSNYNKVANDYIDLYTSMGSSIKYKGSDSASYSYQLGENLFKIYPDLVSASIRLDIINYLYSLIFRPIRNRLSRVGMLRSIYFKLKK